MSVLKRRFNPEQTSDQIYNTETGYCSVELYNACKDIYRVAPSYKIPVPFPWVVKKASQAGRTVFDRLEQRIRNVLSSHNIATRMMGTYNLAAQNTPDKAKDIILIRTQDEFNASWKMAASEIYEMVETEATSSQIQMRVEIRNEEKMYWDVSDFIRDDAAVNTITRIQPSVLAAVEQYCPGKWTSIAYHNRRAPFYNNEKKITAIVFIEPGTMYAWQDFEEVIANVIRSTTFNGEVAISIEILPGRILPAQPSEDALEYLRVSSIPMVPSNGSSIAPALSTDAAGTLGVVVNFRDGREEEVKRCFLTCYHVIAPGDPAGKEVNDSRGIGYTGGGLMPKSTFITRPDTILYKQGGFVWLASHIIKGLKKIMISLNVFANCCSGAYWPSQICVRLSTAC